MLSNVVLLKPFKSVFILNYNSCDNQLMIITRYLVIHYYTMYD